MDIVQILAQRPVTTLISSLLFILFAGNSLNLADCTNNSFQQHLLHSFLHANMSHLMVNLYSIYNLSFLETTLGSTNYAVLITSILILSSYIQHLFGKMNEAGFFPFPTCAVGFSAVILGLVVYYNLTTGGGFNSEQLRQMIVLLIVPFIRNPKTSLAGHLSGIIAGSVISIKI